MTVIFFKVTLFISILITTQCNPSNQAVKNTADISRSATDNPLTSAELAELYPFVSREALPRISRSDYTGERIEDVEGGLRYWKEIDRKTLDLTKEGRPLTFIQAIAPFMKNWNRYVATRNRAVLDSDQGPSIGESEQIEGSDLNNEQMPTSEAEDEVMTDEPSMHAGDHNAMVAVAIAYADDTPHYDALNEGFEEAIDTELTLATIAAEHLETVSTSSSKLSNLTLRSTMIRTALEHSFGFDAGKRVFEEKASLSYGKVIADINALGYGLMPSQNELEDRFRLGRALAYVGDVSNKSQMLTMALLRNLANDVPSNLRGLFWQELLAIYLSGSQHLQFYLSDVNAPTSEALEGDGEQESDEILHAIIQSSGFAAWKGNKQRTYFRNAIENHQERIVRMMIDEFNFDPSRNDNQGNNVLCDAALYAGAHLKIQGETDDHDRQQIEQARNKILSDYKQQHPDTDVYVDDRALNVYDDALGTSRIIQMLPDHLQLTGAESEYSGNGFSFLLSAAQILSTLTTEAGSSVCAGEFDVSIVLSTYFNESMLSSQQYFRLLELLDLLPQREGSIITAEESAHKKVQQLQTRVEIASVFGFCEIAKVKTFVGQGITENQNYNLKMAVWRGYFDEINSSQSTSGISVSKDDRDCFIALTIKDSSLLSDNEKVSLGDSDYAEMRVYYLPTIANPPKPFVFQGDVALLSKWVME